jgi:integrase
VKYERKGCTDKRATEEMARAAENEVAKIKAGLIDPKVLRIAESNRQPVFTHVDVFLASLKQSGRKPKHIVNTRAAINRVLSLAKIERLSELVPSAIVPAIALLKEQGYAPRTIEAHIIAVKSFSRWAWRDGRASDYSLVGLVKPKVQDFERRRVRRALTESELRTLIETTKTAPSWRGLSGFDRSLLYAVASMTGFRRGELMSLTPESFRLDALPPRIVCESGYTKNGQLAEQPIPESLASALLPWLATKRPRHPVFDRMTAWTALMLRRDLERCAIPFQDESGRVVDLHALRHTYITALGRAGLPIKVHQTLARHSDPKLTLNVYTHLSLQDTTRAVESLPDPFHSPSKSEAMIVTGTDPQLINERLAHLLPTAGDGDSRIEPGLVALTEPEILPISSRNPLGVTGEVSLGRVRSHGDATKKNSRRSGPRSITDLVLLVYS